jgi:hypothetical protein
MTWNLPNKIRAFFVDLPENRHSMIEHLPAPAQQTFHCIFDRFGERFARREGPGERYIRLLAPLAFVSPRIALPPSNQSPSMSNRSRAFKRRPSK